MSEKRLVWKLSPELSDGTSYSIVEESRFVIEAVTEWLKEDHAGDSFIVEEVYMTQREMDALPEL